MKKLHTAGLLAIRNRKLLLAYSGNKQCYYLPGGKLDRDESPEQALCREVAEELQVTIQPNDLHYFSHITAPAYGEKTGTIMEQDCFLLMKDIDPRSSAEISEVKYFSFEDYLSMPAKAPGAVMILEQLKAAGLID
jgi:8-oxo-dGTP pyrophosphatase MutT (NUDIX family)